MNKRILEFYLEYGGNRVRVTPYYKKLEKKTAKEARQEFYRDSLQGLIKFVGDDFQLIYNEPITTEFTFIIRLFYRDSWSEYYRGTFTKVNCKLDIAKQTAEPKFKTDDLYKKVLDKYKDEFDIVKLGVPTTSINCTKRPFVQIYCAGASAITNIHNGKSWETDTSSAIDDENEIKSYGFSSLAVFREIQIEGADIEGVNGLYTRHEYFETADSEQVMFYTHRWYKLEHEVQQYFIEITSSYMNVGTILYARIYSIGGNSPLYEVPEASNLPYDTMFDQKGSLLNLVFTKANGSGFATVTKDFCYDLYGRILHNKTSEGSLIKINDFAISNISYKRTSPLTEARLFISSDSTIEKTPHGVNDYGEYFTDKWLPTLFPTDRYVPIVRSSWVNASIWLVYEKTKFDSLYDTYSVSYTLRDAYSVGQVIKTLLAQIDTRISHEASSSFSKFLYDSEFILASMPERFYVYLTQKTNMIKGTYDQAAQTAKISLEAVMNMLRDCFRCYWYINDRGEFKIEHISYFLKGLSYIALDAQVDLTQYKDQFNKKSVLYQQETLEYDISDLTRKYTFAFADESFLPFTGVSLEVEALYIEGDKVEDINAGEFSADVDYMQISSESVTQDGFALLCPIYSANAYELPIRDVQTVENGRPYTIMVQNAYASWSQLVSHYAWDMPGSNISSDSFAAFPVYGLKECVTQSIKMPYASALSPYMLVNTQLGKARIVSVSESADTGYLTLDLVYSLG